MKPFRNLIILALIPLLAACNYNTIRMNSEIDKPAGEKITFMFFEDVRTQNYQSTYSLFSNDFWKVTSKDKVGNIFKTSKNKLGALKDMSLDKWETRVVVGSNPSAPAPR
ncbi:MAG: hypothetical protein JKY70_14560 [Mucilaginibacter sp.]|nr:hypothetical protein [Mucilaginibacter sp.]